MKGLLEKVKRVGAHSTKFRITLEVESLQIHPLFWEDPLGKKAQTEPKAALAFVWKRGKHQVFSSAKPIEKPKQTEFSWKEESDQLQEVFTLYFHENAKKVKTYQGKESTISFFLLSDIDSVASGKEI